MKRTAIKMLFVAAIFVSPGAWSASESQLRCGLSLGAPDLEQEESTEAKKEFANSNRSLAGPRVEKVERRTEAESFKVISTDRLLPETLTLANFGCSWRF